MIDGGVDRDARIAGHKGIEDGRLDDETVLVKLGLGPDVIGVEDELAIRLADQVERDVAVEVDPDQHAGDAALGPGVRPEIGANHGVDGRLFAVDGTIDGLGLGEGHVADGRPDVGGRNELQEWVISLSIAPVNVVTVLPMGRLPFKKGTSEVSLPESSTSVFF